METSLSTVSENKKSYVLYEDTIDEASDSIMMRMHERRVDNVRSALALYKEVGARYDGILEVNVDGEEIEHPISYYEEQLQNS